METGIVKGAGADIMGVRHIFHPATGAKLIGLDIPRWNDLIDFVFSACAVIPAVRLTAWDVAVLEDGFELIEGNHNGDPGLMQAPGEEGQLEIIKKFIRS